ncbi:MAG: hypothetical protein COZ38_10090 [Rhodocyclales bacterium CG_4_10_14_3_um_filter_68_10]|nr:MAG: hypothetical protein COZ38_10090 [Rhodocyclales bacterium CG_4_10_14_3_um_filter_68_10]
MNARGNPVLSAPGASPAGAASDGWARAQRGILAAVAVLVAAVAVQAAPGGWRLAALFGVGILLGVTLHQFSFGFTSAYRRWIVNGDTRGVRAQLLMLALATLLFAPLLAAGEAFGYPLGGANAPLGVQVVAGAFLFGIGMQLGGGCGSGTLYAAGGGSPRMLVVLAAFCAGSFWASLHMGWWQATPSWGELALGELVGWGTAAGVQTAVLMAAFFLLRRRDSSRDAAGVDPLMIGGVALALLNAATLILAGHPWSITWGYTLWGAKTAATLGWQAADGFWTAPFQSAALAANVLHDVTSLMDVGVLLGAATSAALAGRFSPQWRIPPRSLAAALLGGVLMGYGARIAFGCNVGAFFSGVASTSLHGWLWIAAALAGCRIGVRLRPRFGLTN